MNAPTELRHPDPAVALAAELVEARLAILSLYRLASRTHDERGPEQIYAVNARLGPASAHIRRAIRKAFEAAEFEPASIPDWLYDQTDAPPAPSPLSQRGLT